MWAVYLVFMTIIGLFCRELYRKIMFDAIPEKFVHGEIIESNETDILYFAPSALRGVRSRRTLEYRYILLDDEGIRHELLRGQNGPYPDLHERGTAVCKENILVDFHCDDEQE